jgi:REP element-mobilizing transposase RayT
VTEGNLRIEDGPLFSTSPKGANKEQKNKNIMAYTNLLYHIVFRPKNSESVIPIDKEELLYRYIWGFVKNKKGVLYRIGGMPDHIHILVQLSPTIAISDFVRDLKIASGLFLENNKSYFPKFKGWARSYCAITYSKSEKDIVINYIKNQKEHHRKRTLHDELLELLREADIDVDMTYFLKD